MHGPASAARTGGYPTSASPSQEHACRVTTGAPAAPPLPPPPPRNIASLLLPPLLDSLPLPPPPLLLRLPLPKMESLASTQQCSCSDRRLVGGGGGCHTHVHSVRGPQPFWELVGFRRSEGGEEAHCLRLASQSLAGIAAGISPTHLPGPALLLLPGAPAAAPSSTGRWPALRRAATGRTAARGSWWRASPSPRRPDSCWCRALPCEAPHHPRSGHRRRRSWRSCHRRAAPPVDGMDARTASARSIDGDARRAEASGGRRAADSVVSLTGSCCAATIITVAPRRMARRSGSEIGLRLAQKLGAVCQC